MMGLSPVQKIKMVRSFWDIPYIHTFYESMQRELCTFFIIPIFCMDSQKSETEKCSVSRFREVRCGIVSIDFLKIALRAFISRSK